MGRIVINELSKSYNKGRIMALDNLSFEVGAGELFGLIGPDGAGKTSLFRILSTLLLPDAGRVAMNGYDVVQDYKLIRRQLGYMPGNFSLYQDLTVAENLQFFAHLFHTKVSEHYSLIQDIYQHLAPFKDRRAGKLSGGMKQKLALCCALIHRPAILLLDEPTTGVDVVSRKEFWQTLQQLKLQGITVLVSTPYMDEANACERVALLQHGKLLALDSPNAIIQQFSAPLYAIKSDDMGRLLKDLRQSGLLSSCNAFGAYHHLTFREDSPRERKQLLDSLRINHPQLQLQVIAPTIEDCFIKLMD